MRILVAILVVGAASALALGPVNADDTADATAHSFAISHQPQAHWHVAQRTFEPWASNVVRGTYRLTGLSGPPWVVELNAPPDATWKRHPSALFLSSPTRTTTSPPPPPSHESPQSLSH